MAENGLKNQKVIGVAFDGTGLGSDNTLWGAEFLICDYKNFVRRAHLKEIPLLGGEKAILQPFRLVVAWLYSIYKDRFSNFNIDFIKRLDTKNWPVLKKMLLSGFNSPLTSSMGRLFDAVASLVLVKQKANFEAELAIELEKLAVSFQLSALSHQSSAVSYQIKISKHKHKYILDPALMFKGIIEDLKRRAPKEKIAYQFHLAVARMIARTSQILRKNSGINKLVLSGGVFQNKLLLRLSLDLLYKQDFKVYTHKNLACNDSSISLGQALIADFL
jgi:hydrogenase maturation protein HypF